MSGRTFARWQHPSVERYPVPRAVQFVTADEFLKLALQSHLAAVRDTIPPSGELWCHPEGEMAWSGPQDFFDGLLAHLGERLRRRALSRGDLVEQPSVDDEDESEGPVGEAMGHGCPALSPAVGPALETVEGREHNRSADPFFAVQNLKDLQCEKIGVNNPSEVAGAGHG